VDYLVLLVWGGGGGGNKLKGLVVVVLVVIEQQQDFQLPLEQPTQLRLVLVGPGAGQPLAERRITEHQAGFNSVFSTITSAGWWWWSR
jgi:hypothetical protein